MGFPFITHYPLGSKVNGNPGWRRIHQDPGDLMNAWKQSEEKIKKIPTFKNDKIVLESAKDKWIPKVSPFLIEKILSNKISPKMVKKYEKITHF